MREYPRIAVNLEEEVVNLYETTVVRMKKAGYDVVKFFSRMKALGNCS